MEKNHMFNEMMFCGDSSIEKVIPGKERSQMIQSGKDGQFEMNCVSFKSYLASRIGEKTEFLFLVLSPHLIDLMEKLK